MMKKAILIMLIFSFLPLYSQWIPNGNNMVLNIKQTDYRQFSISGDNKILYLTDDSNRIDKYDLNTGEYLGNLQTIAANNTGAIRSRTYLSNDGVSYSVSLSYESITTIGSSSTSYFQNKIYFVDIANNTVKDSIILYDTTYYSIYKPQLGISFVDYNSKLNKAIIGSFYTFYQIGGYEINDNTGTLRIYTNANGKWTPEIDGGGEPMHWTYNQSHDRIFAYQVVDNSTYVHSNPHHSSSFRQYSNLSYDLIKLTIDTVAFYRYTGEDNNWSGTGIRHDFTSAAYSNGNNELKLIENNMLYNYDFTTSAFNKQLTVKPYYTYPQLYIFNLLDSNYFVINNGNDLLIYRSDKYLFCNTITIQNSDSIKSLQTVQDGNYIIFTDNRNKIHKMNIIDIFKLNANFAAPDSIGLVGDSVQFYDCSTRYPDEYLWDFGDGNTSNERDPAHVYLDTGFYNVKLIIKKGDETSQVVKERYVHVLPQLTPEFDYTLSGSYPVHVKFTNKSTGDIDSVLWNFGDGTTSKEFNPVHDYIYPESHIVKLTLYSMNKSKSIEKTITLNTIDPGLDTSIFKYEICDTTESGFEAVTAYEDGPNNIIYLNRKDSTKSRLGSFANAYKQWEKPEIEGKSFLRTRENGYYAWIYSNYITNINFQGEQNGESVLMPSENIFSVRNDLNELIVSHGDVKDYNMKSGFEVLNSSNNIIYHISPPIKGLYYSLVSYRLLYLICIKSDNYYDMALVNEILSTDPYSYKHINNFAWVNDYNVSNSYKYDKNRFTEVIRLNSNQLVYSGKDSLYIVNTRPYELDSTVQYPFISYEYVSKNCYANYNFVSLLKLNDSTFVAAGSKSGHPAFVVINDKGALLDSIVINNRVGEFNFISATKDSEILLCGYKNLDYNKIAPYFVKTNLQLIQRNYYTDTYPRGLITLKNGSFPNPSVNLTNISFNLEKKSQVNIYIADYRGNCILNETRDYDKGTNLYKMDFSLHAPGVYYYRIRSDSETWTGQIEIAR